MFGVTGILREQRTGNSRAFAAMNEAFVLTTHCYRTFTMIRMPVCGYTAAAIIGFLKFTVHAMKSAASVNNFNIPPILIRKVAYD